MAVEILGVRVDGPDLETFQKACILALTGQLPLVVYTPNPEMLVKAVSDTYFRRALNTGSLNVCDGFGLYLAARARGAGVTRLTGVDCFLSLVSLANEQNKRLFLLGTGSERAIHQAAQVLRLSFPSLPLCGYDAGPTIVENDAGALVVGTVEQQMLIKKINDAAPEILVVAFGMGKQEKWIHENIAKLPSVRIVIGVGGAMDFIAGIVPRAPLLMRQFGLEWLYRVVKQPQRIGRIWNATFTFIWLLITKK